MKVAIYPRLSEEDRNKKNATDESESIQNQKSMLIAYAVEKGWEIYDIYCDEDWSGADRNRPEFNRLLKDAEAKKFEIILCKSQARFTRELELVEKYINGKFLEWGIRFIGLTDNADTENKGNKKSRQINGLVNEWYLEDLSDSIRSVFADKIKNGCHIGSFALYGYKKDPNLKGHLLIDEPAAAVVREVYNLFLQGYGKTEIARQLNERGIPNPTEYKRQQGLRYMVSHDFNSTLWRYSTIGYMLKNEMYTGTMVQGRTHNVSYKCDKKINVPKDEWVRKLNTHEAIIDTDLWNQVQEIIKLRAKPFSDTGKIGIFAKKVRCLNCHYVMRSCKHHDTRYLQCATRYALKSACLGAMISIPRLEKIVLQELKTMMNEWLDKDFIEENIKFTNNIEKQISIIKKNIQTCENNIQHSTNAIKNLYLDKTKGIITDDEFITFSHEFHKDKLKNEKIITSYQNQIMELQNKLEQSETKKELIEKYTNFSKLTRELVETFIDYIEIGTTIPGTRNKPIEIHWNF